MKIAGAEMERKYQGLKMIGLVLKIAGGLEMILGVASLVLVPLVFSGANGALSQLGLPISSPGAVLVYSILAGIIILMVGVVAGLLTFALGELINVVIEIEKNTRESANKSRANHA